MKESGRVVKKINPNVVEIELQESSACVKCGLCHLNKSGTLTLEASDDIGVSVGDSVEVYIPESRVILSSLMLFIFPLVAFFSGYLLRGIILAVILLSVYMLFVYFYDKKAKIAPKVIRLLSNT